MLLIVRTVLASCAPPNALLHMTPPRHVPTVLLMVSILLDTCSLLAFTISGLIYTPVSIASWLVSRECTPSIMLVTPISPTHRPKVAKIFLESGLGKLLPLLSVRTLISALWLSIVIHPIIRPFLLVAVHLHRRAVLLSISVLLHRKVSVIPQHYGMSVIIVSVTCVLMLVVYPLASILIIR